MLKPQDLKWVSSSIFVAENYNSEGFLIIGSNKKDLSSLAPFFYIVFLVFL